ncbi:MAG: hypothetical protein EOO50_14040 [Flavobacterium sp.]|uniref:hypothetical protein n=1 Tax=Flavobacterium sp. TaxID=239 RepID=UPI00120351DD|nr:hypothetical protein [Flavobacterium sp.]RZJ65369.1 MAG: hypothetical protein EOO50_14040 [Flavobacterium sp.]
MTIRFISTALLASLAFVSCKKDLEPQESSVPLSASVTPTAAAAPAQQATPQPQAAAVTQQVATGGVNPAHGQPGHRCDIAVGAPLTQAATTTQQVTPQQPQQPQQIQTQMQVPSQKVAKGMNPAHGQPGHRCDIAVGAPLNQPAKPAASSVVMNSDGSKSNDNVTITPAQISSDGKLVPGSGGNNVKVTTSNTPASTAPAILQAPGEATKAGMNPAHGQPGHRCDIAVGAALPK